MDSSDAPTHTAVNRHMTDDQSDAGLVSFLTADIGEDEDFARVAVLCGRDSEIEQICAAYERGSRGKSEAFLVHGVSGTGKSSLIESMREAATSNEGGYFVSGKFDQLVTRKEPFSAIAAAFSDICDLILQSDQLDERRKTISAALGSDTQLLSRVVSNINEVAKYTNCGAEDVDRGGLSVNTEDFTRFRLACQKFLRAVATEDHPLLIFLDDLQWADEMSLKLIKSLLKDTSSHHMLLCLAYRNDEIDGKQILDLDDANTNGLPFTEVAVKNLDSNDLCLLLAQMLHIHDMPSLEPLTALILAKTKGNPNVVIQLLQHLKSKRLLKFSDETYNWEWDMNRIESEVSDNPTEIIAQKINSLDAEVRDMLTLAAYIGHSFSIEILQLVIASNTEHAKSPSDINAEASTSGIKTYLKVAIDNNLIEEEGKKRCRFSHDSYQHYLYNSMENESERQLVHLRIGRTIAKHVADYLERTESLLFLAASNMTRGAIHIHCNEERVATMQLFLEAAKLAASKVSIVDAKQYVECAVRMIQISDPTEHHVLFIDIQNTYAELQSSSGVFGESDRAVDTVLREAKTMKERVRAQCTKIRSLVYQGKMDEVLDWTFSVVLKDLGEVIPTRPSSAQVLIEFVRAKLALRKTKPEDFLRMPEMENEQKLAVMEVLNILFPVMFLLPDKAVYIYCALRQIRLTMKYGISPCTAGCLVSYALVLTSRGEIDVANRLGAVALEIASREGHMQSTLAQCLAGTAMFIYPRQRRLESGLDQMYEAYRIGLTCGSDFTTASYGLSGYLETRCRLGAPLDKFEEEMRHYSRQMKDLQAHKIASYLVIRWQYVLNLLGESEDPVILNGEAMTELEHLRYFNEEGDALGLHALHLCRMKLQISFEDWNSVKNTLPLVINGFFASVIAGHYSHFFSATEIALASLAVYALSGQKKFRRIAHKFMKVMRRWSQDGVPDIKPLLALVDAEWAAVVEKNDTTKGFEAAIVALKKSKFVEFEVIAYQRAMHMMMQQLNIRGAREYLEKSLERHREWGNTAKAEWLRSHYSGILNGVKPAFVVEVEVKSDILTEEELCAMNMH